MSEYSHIFARKDDTFIELACTCRNSYISEALRYFAPWEAIRPMTEEIYNHIVKNLKESRENYKSFIQKHKDAIQAIAQFNNPAEEKLDAIYAEQESIEEIQQELDEVEAALQLFYFIHDVSAIIYFGCECGSEVTKDDIVKGEPLE